MALTPISVIQECGNSLRGAVPSITQPAAAAGLFFDLSRFNSGSFLLPTGGNTTWTWYASPTADGTYTLIEAAGTAGVQTAVAAKWNAIPAAVFAHRFVKVTAGAEVLACAFEFKS